MGKTFPEYGAVPRKPEVIPGLYNPATRHGIELAERLRYRCRFANERARLYAGNRVKW